jgi:hypothetical protein
MKYRTTETPAGLLVHDVEILRPISKQERPDFRKAVDLPMMQRMVANYYARKTHPTLPKTAQLFRRHNRPGFPADVIGTVESARVVDGWIRGDILITDPEARAKALRGELPNRSPEMDVMRDLLWGLSLIDGEEGQMGDTLPDLKLAPPNNVGYASEVKELELVCCALFNKDSNMELAAALARIKELETELAAAKDPEVESRFEKLSKSHGDAVAIMRTELEGQIRTAQSEAQVEKMVNDLKANGCALTFKQCREKLSKCTNEESRKLMFDTLKGVREGGFKLDLDVGAPTIEQELTKEYLSYKAAHPETSFTAESYIALHTQPRKDFSGRTVNEM